MSDYPQHEKFQELKENLEAVQEFVEWFIAHGPTARAYACGCCDATGKIPLHRLHDRQKGDLILEAFGIDVKEFYAEKERMVEELSGEKLK